MKKIVVITLILIAGLFLFSASQTSAQPACEINADCDDGISDYNDNCPSVSNPNQEDTDGDEYGDACDNCWTIDNTYQLDSDNDCPKPPYFSDPACGDVCVTTTTPVPGNTIPEFPWFSQKDERWSEHIMGNTNYTIGDQGCAMTCVAMLHKAEIGGYAPGPMDPGVLNDFLNEKGGYDGRLINWEVADRWDDEEIRWRSTNGDGLEHVELIKTTDETCKDNWEYLSEQLDQGRKVVLKVDDAPDHWVLVYKREGNSGDPGSYYMNDPELEEYEERTLQYYYNKHPETTFYACSTYEGEEWISLETTTSLPSTSTTISTGCPSEQIYGTDSPETELLRSLRDNVLSKTQEGRELIKLYYQWSPIIVRAMEVDEEFKQEIKEMIDEVLPLIEGRD